MVLSDDESEVKDDENLCIGLLYLSNPISYHYLPYPILYPVAMSHIVFFPLFCSLSDGGKDWGVIACVVSDPLHLVHCRTHPPIVLLIVLLTISCAGKLISGSSSFGHCRAPEDGPPPHLLVIVGDRKIV